MRHKVPNWRPRCAILPSITLLIAEDEARSAESGLAILFSCSFSHIFLNLSAFLIFFLPIGGSTLKHNFLFLSYILFYFGVLPNLYLIFRSCIPRTLSHIVTTLGYFRILLHQLLLGTTSSFTFGHLLLGTTTDPVFCQQAYSSKIFIL